MLLFSHSSTASVYHCSSLIRNAPTETHSTYWTLLGGALESAASDVPKGEEEEDRDLDSETSAGGDMYGDLHGGEGEGNDGDDMYGDLGGDDGDDAVDEDEENKAVLDSVSDTAALSASTETAASLTTGTQTSTDSNLTIPMKDKCMCSMCSPFSDCTTSSPSQTARLVRLTSRKAPLKRPRGITAELHQASWKTSRTHCR